MKPLDEEMVLASVAKTGCAVTAENHSVIGGLGSAVAELLVEKDPVPVKKVGVMDHFGEVGLTPYLKEKYGLTAKDIIAAAKVAIAMKRGKNMKKIIIGSDKSGFQLKEAVKAHLVEAGYEVTDAGSQSEENAMFYYEQLRTWLQE